MALFERLLQNPAFRASAFLTLFSLAVALAALLLMPVLAPLLLALIFYTLLSPLAELLKRGGWGQTQSILFSFMLLVALIGFGLVLAIPALVDQLSTLSDRFPMILDKVTRLAKGFEQWLNQSTGFDFTSTGISAYLGSFTRGSAALIETLTSLLVNTTTTLILAPIFTFFLLRDLRTLRNQLMGLLPNRSFELGWLIYAKVVRQLQAYVQGVMMQSAVMATVTGIGFWALGLEMAALLGITAGLLNVIPYVGPILALIPPTFLVLGAGADPLLPLLGVVSVVLGAQLFDNLVVVPSLIAQAADLHPLTVLIGIIVVGNLFGFIGMIFAIPLLFSAKLIYLGLLRGLSARAAEKPA